MVDVGTGAAAGVAAGVSDAAALYVAEDGTEAEPVAGVEVGIEVHQTKGKLEAADWSEVVDEALVFVAHRGNVRVVLEGPAGAAAAAAAGYSAGSERTRRVRCMLKEELPQRQPEDCCV